MRIENRTKHNFYKIIFHSSAFFTLFHYINVICKKAKLYIFGLGSFRAISLERFFHFKNRSQKSLIIIFEGIIKSVFFVISLSFM